MPNIREVAKLANVSIATVSRVINGNDNVSEETRKKVLNAMKKLNYKPAISFKDASNTLMHTIGLLMPDIRGYHYSDIVMAIEEYAYIKNFDIMIALPKWEADMEQHVLDQYFRRKVDGIILGELFGGHKLIERFKRSGIPIVVVDFAVDEIDFDVVSVNNVGGGYSAVKYLHECGHKDILFVPGPEQSPAALDREKGIRKFLEKFNLKNQVNIYYGEHRGYNSEHGWVSVTKHLKKYGLNFSAIFAVNDWAALGAIDALKDNGIKVPDEVSVIGFDDAPFAQYMNPKLTTVMQPRWEMGTTAAQLLTERIIDKRFRLPRNVVLPTKIIERESVKRI